MSFSLSGSSVIQTGTDANLSGMVGIGGVTLEGNTYILNGRRLVVSGDLTMNGWTEKIQFRNSPTDTINNSASQISVPSGGKFTVSTNRTINGGDVNRLLPVIDFGDFRLTFGITAFGNASRRHIACDIGGEVNLSGVFTARTIGSGLAYALDGTTNIRDAFFINQSNTQGSNQQFAFAGGGAIQVDNGNIIGYAYTDRGGDWQSVNGLTVSEDSEGYVWNGAYVTPRYLELDGYDPAQISVNDWRTNLYAAGGVGSVVNLLNCSVGNALKYTSNQTVAFQLRLLLTNVLNVTPVDTTFNSISTKIYATDINNGNRDIDFTPPGQAPITASTDIVYTAAGADITFNVLSGVMNPDRTLDARGLSGGADLLFLGISYNHKIATFQPNLTGLGNKTISPIHPDDTDITEPNYLITAALGSIDTSQRVYDRAKLFLFDNYSGESQTIVTRSGNIIDTRSYNFIASATHAQAFSFDGSTVFLKAATFAGDIETTGSVSLDAISDGQTIIDSQDVTISTLPASLTLDNAVLNLPAGSDVTAYEEINTAGYRATAHGEYVARGKDASIIDANGFNVTIITDPLPTPSTMIWDGDLSVRWAIYDQTGTFIESGDGDKTLANAGDVDSGPWTIVSHRAGHAAQIDKWVSDDGTTTSLSFSGALQSQVNGGVAYVAMPTPNVTAGIFDNKIRCLIKNTSVAKQEVYTAQQDFLNTDAGLDWIRITTLILPPTHGFMNGQAGYFNVQGFTYDSVPGVTPESKINAVFENTATHSFGLTDNGGTQLGGGAVNAAAVARAVWNAHRTDHANEGSMGEALDVGSDCSKIAAQNTQT